MSRNDAGIPSLIASCKETDPLVRTGLSMLSPGIFRSIVVEGRKPAEPERVAEAEASSIPSYEAFRVGPFVPDGPCFAGRSDRVKRTYCVKSRMNTYSSGIL